MVGRVGPHVFGAAGDARPFHTLGGHCGLVHALVSCGSGNQAFEMGLDAKLKAEESGVRDGS